VLTLTEPALHAQRPSGLVHDDHRVGAVGLARTAQIVNLIAGAKHSITAHGAFRMESWAFCIEHRALPPIFAT
jgi:hypothetical protein